MRVNTGFLPRGIALLVTGPLRYLIVPAWIAATVLAFLHLPGMASESSGRGSLGAMAPRNAPALKVEERSLRLFQIPVLGRTAIVQRDPQGLSRAAQKRVILRAVAVDRHPGRDPSGIAAMGPIINVRGIVPASRETLTTAITYLFFPPWRGLFDQAHRAIRYAHTHITAPGDGLVGVTGIVPARVEEGNLVADALPLIEAGTVLLIALIVGVTFRALAAPVITLFAAGIAYQLAIHVIGYLAGRSGQTIPVELEPLLVVLILAVCTDYAIFFLSGTKRCLQAGSDRVTAARTATAEFIPIIVTAGLTIVGCTACLEVANFDFLRALGPALAVGVALAMLVSITLIPAILAILGHAVYWPSLAADPASERLPRRVAALRSRFATWLVARKWAALLLAVVLVGVLGAAGSGLRQMRIGIPLLSDLPGNTPEGRATRAAGRGFAPGIISPTLILVEGHGMPRQRPALARLEALIAREPGVAGIVGPREQPPGAARAIAAAAANAGNAADVVAAGPSGDSGALINLAAALGGKNSASTADYGPAFSRDGTAARYILIWNADPLGAQAMTDLGALEKRMPALLRAAGLPSVRAGFAGDTALAKETIDRLVGSMVQVGMAVGLVVLVMLALFLRSLVAPLYLLVASVLSAAAPMGLVTYLYEHHLGYPYLGYYAPLGAGVLLIALGCDYNLFMVGRVWQEARSRPLADAIAIAVPAATGAIRTAAITLSASFALMAIVPLASFREFALTMTLGVLVDAFIVRSFLVLALLALFGRASMWPRRLDAPTAPVPPAQPAPQRELAG